MRTKILKQNNEADLIDVAELRKQTESDEDVTYLEQLLDASIDWAEGYTNRKFYHTEAIAFWSEYKEKIFLPFGEVTHIISLVAIGASGDYEAISFVFNEIEESIKIDRKYACYTDFKVKFICGYGNYGDNNSEPVAPPVPQSIIHALKMYVATLYAERENTGISKKGVVNSEHLLDRHKIRAI